MTAIKYYLFTVNIKFILNVSLYDLVFKVS